MLRHRQCCINRLNCAIMLIKTIVCSMWNLLFPLDNENDAKVQDSSIVAMARELIIKQ